MEIINGYHCLTCNLFVEHPKERETHLTEYVGHIFVACMKSRE